MGNALHPLHSPWSGPSDSELTSVSARQGRDRGARQRFRWSEPLLVGATGFEPVTPSVSVNAGLPLC